MIIPSSEEVQMKTSDIERAAVQTLIEQMEGIILLDLKGIQSTWKNHIDELYAKLQELRSVCGLNDC